MADRSTLLVPFGLREGRMWRPDQVQRGLACRCTCPCCNGALEARNGGRVRQPYFAHDDGSRCRGGFESAVHAMSKQLLVDAMRVLLPEWSGAPGMPAQPSFTDEWGLTHRGARIHRPAQMSHFSQAYPERAVGGIRPDVLAHDQDGALLVEVRVAHAVDRAKAEVVRAKRYRMIEIDLSRVRADDAADAERFAHLVLDEPSNRHWVSMPDAEDQWRAVMAELKAAAPRIPPPPPVQPATDLPYMPPAPLGVAAHRVDVTPQPPGAVLLEVQIGSRIWHTGRGSGIVREQLPGTTPIYRVEFDGHGLRTIVLDEAGRGSAWQVLDGS